MNGIRVPAIFVGLCLHILFEDIKTIDMKWRVPLKRVLTWAVIFLICPLLHAQRVSVKSNILSDAFLNPNAGVGFGLAPKWTLDLSGGSTCGPCPTTVVGSTG